MSRNERHICSAQGLRDNGSIYAITQEFAAVGARAKVGILHGARKFLETIPLPEQGETVDLCERGIRFKAAQPHRRSKCRNILHTSNRTDRAGNRRREVQLRGWVRLTESGHKWPRGSRHRHRVRRAHVRGAQLG
jgi:hypothetical protein